MVVTQFVGDRESPSAWILARLQKDRAALAAWVRHETCRASWIWILEIHDLDAVARCECRQVALAYSGKVSCLTKKASEPKSLLVHLSSLSRRPAWRLPKNRAYSVSWRRASSVSPRY